MQALLDFTLEKEKVNKEFAKYLIRPVYLKDKPHFKYQKEE
jgi:hypothetical protein